MIDKNFFVKPADLVARNILGKILIRKTNDGGIKKARIVETEAYFDESDPASRAVQNGDLRATMQMDAGTILVYGVHNNWLFNIVTGRVGEAAAVLIRALEPINFDSRCNGPGLLTKSMDIGKSFHQKSILFGNSLSLTEDKNQNHFDIVESFRIGVRMDLPKKLRFYIKGNKNVSRK